MRLRELATTLERVVEIALPIALLLSYLIGLTTWVSTDPDGPLRADFASLFAAAKVVASGDVTQLYNLDYQGAVQRQITAPYVFAGGVLAYLNPPFFALALSPLTALPYKLAFGVWVALGVVLYLLSIRLLLSMPPRLPRRHHRTVWLFALGFYPAFAAVLLGQTTFISFAVFAASLSLLARRHEFSSGAILALGLFKPHLILPWVVILVWQRRWRALTGFGAIGLALSAVSWSVVGLQGLIDYVRLLNVVSTWEEVSGFNAVFTYSWNGFWRLFLPGDLRLATIATYVSDAVTLGILLYIWRKQPIVGTPRFWKATALSFAAAPLLVSHVLIYDMHFWFIAAIAVARFVPALAPRQKVPLFACVLAGYLLPFLTPELSFKVGNLHGGVLLVMAFCIVISTLPVRDDHTDAKVIAS